MTCRLIVSRTSIPATRPETVLRIREVEAEILKRPQFTFETEHVFHAGLYTRTVRIPRDVAFTSVLIKIPTMLIVNGTCDLLMDDVGVRLTGYNVLACEAERKQVYRTITDVELTMIFASKAKSVEEAEAEFTDEAESLQSRTNKNDIVMTEAPCRASQPQLLS